MASRVCRVPASGPTPVRAQPRGRQLSPARLSCKLRHVPNLSTSSLAARNIPRSAEIPPAGGCRAAAPTADRRREPRSSGGSVRDVAPPQGMANESAAFQTRALHPDAASRRPPPIAQRAWGGERSPVSSSVLRPRGSSASRRTARRWHSRSWSWTTVRRQESSTCSISQVTPEGPWAFTRRSKRGSSDEAARRLDLEVLARGDVDHPGDPARTRSRASSRSGSRRRSCTSPAAWDR